VFSKTVFSIARSTFRMYSVMAFFKSSTVFKIFLRVLCIVIIRCTETFWSPCTSFLQRDPCTSGADWDPCWGAPGGKCRDTKLVLTSIWCIGQYIHSPKRICCKELQYKDNFTSTSRVWTEGYEIKIKMSCKQTFLTVSTTVINQAMSHVELIAICSEIHKKTHEQTMWVECWILCRLHWRYAEQPLISKLQFAPLCFSNHIWPVGPQKIVEAGQSFKPKGIQNLKKLILADTTHVYFFSIKC
jgi:hypothetical protein